MATKTRLDDARDLLLSALAEGVRSMDPAKLVELALPPLPPKHASVRVVAVGKAAAAMSRGAFLRWGDRIDRAVVIIPEESSTQQSSAQPERLLTLASPHPIPNERSVVAADAASDLVRALCSRDLVLALVSGGASSLIAKPPPGVSLAKKRELVRELLRGGADIREVNLVRRHFSRIKGGRLALAASPARVLTLCLSDVIHGEAHDIGSGPTVADPTSLEEARAVLHRMGPHLASLGEHLSESVKPGDNNLRLRSSVIASPKEFAWSVATALSRKGLQASTEDADSLDIESTVQRRAALARALPKGASIVIPCEPTICLGKDNGRGGRATHVALSIMRSLPPGVVFMAAASDGVDGSSNSAGAIVDNHLSTEVGDNEIDESLAARNSGALLEKLRCLIPRAPSGLNFADVHILTRLSA